MKKIKSVLLALFVLLLFSACDVMKLLTNPQAFALLGDNAEPFVISWDFSVYSDGEEIREGWDGLTYTYNSIFGLHCGLFQGTYNTGEFGHFELHPDRDTFYAGNYEIRFNSFAESDMSMPDLTLIIQADGAEILSNSLGEVPVNYDSSDFVLDFSLLQEYKSLSFIFSLMNNGAAVMTFSNFICDVEFNYRGTDDTNSADPDRWEWDFSDYSDLSMIQDDGWSNLAWTEGAGNCQFMVAMETTFSFDPGLTLSPGNYEYSILYAADGNAGSTLTFTFYTNGVTNASFSGYAITNGATETANAFTVEETADVSVDFSTSMPTNTTGFYLSNFSISKMN